MNLRYHKSFERLFIMIDRSESMRKSIKFVILFVFIIIFGVLLFLLNSFYENKDITSDEKKFKKEYESLNGKESSDDKEMLSITIPLKNYIKYIDSSTVIERLSKGSSVLYFGFPACPWCRNLIPELLKVNEEYQLPIYYYNALDIRDKKHLDDDGNVITDTEGSKEYYKILELLGEKASRYDGLEDDSIKRLYFPTVVFVKGGEVMGVYEGTVASQNNPYERLSKKQKGELFENLEKYFDKMTVSVCDKDQAC